MASKTKEMIALYIAGVFIGLVVMGIALVFDLRRTKAEEDEMIKRQDKVMMKTKDDQNEPARWVP